MKPFKWFIITIVIMVIGGIAISKLTDQPDSVSNLQATVYKSPTCGCCGNYVSYLKGQGYKVEVVETSDMDNIKQTYNIPVNKQSCHTTVIGDKFVEGHIPVEVINKMMAGDSTIKGIALPDMPSGSPGMPGAKTEDWEISQLGADGNWSEFIKY